MNSLSPLNSIIGFLTPVQPEAGSAARLGLQRLLLLRSFVTVVSVLGMFLFRSQSSLSVPVGFIMTLALGVLASVLLGYWRLRQARVISNLELFLHLMIDVIFLVVLLLNTGGISNPLISYLLVLLAVSATLLPKIYVHIFSIGCIVIYTSFLWFDLTSEHSGMDPAAEEMTFQLHLVGMWVIFLVSAVLITVFITRMARAIQERENNLAKARETELRNEQLVAIGTLAAGTAHALGTPLSTMAVLLTELDKLDTSKLSSNEVKEDISLLRQQVTRCKNSLTQLTQYYNKDNDKHGENISVASFVSDITDYIVNIHPSAYVEFEIKGNDKQLVSSDLSVKHAVINIIENSIKAAKSKVDVEFQVDETNSSQLEVSVKDDGPGIPARVMEMQGQPFISMHKESMGLGIFLANAAVERLGGSIEMVNLKAGGARTIIHLPLAPKSVLA